MAERADRSAAQGSSHSRWLAAALLGLIVVEWVIGLLTPLPADMPQGSIGATIIGTLMQLTLPIVAFVVAWKQPAHRLGWVLLAGAAAASTGLTLTNTIAPAYRPDWASWLVYPGDLLFYVGVAVLAGYFFILFPTGHPPSPRWRPVVWAGGVGVVGVAVWSVMRPCSMYVTVQGPTGYPACDAPLPAGYLRFENPLGLKFPGGDSLWGVIGGLSLALVLLLFFLGAASVFVRYRKASSVERAQLRWPSTVLALVVPPFLLVAILDLAFGWDSTGASFVIFAALAVALPISIGVAITKYRLFEIDRILSRTVSYVILLGCLALLFVSATALPAAVIGSDETPSWMIAAATLGVAAVFSPLRRRLHVLVDRRFNRSSYDAEQIALRFAEQVRDATEVESVEENLVEAVVGILQPASIGFWARSEVL